VPALLLQLRSSPNYELRVIGVDNAPTCLAASLVDKYYSVPMGSSPEYISTMLEITEREGVDALLPGSDEEAYALSGAVELFRQKGTEVIVSSRTCMEMITNKLAVYKALEKSGIAVPEYSVATTGEEMLNSLETYDFPNRSVIIKPSTGRGGRGLHVFCGNDSPPEWLGDGLRETRLSNANPTVESLQLIADGEMLVMPCMHAPVYDADVLASYGDVKAIVVRRRTNPTGIPFHGNRIMVEQDAISYCSKIAAAVGLNALHDMDLMTNDEGELRLLEVNPRPSGSLVASLAAGEDLVDAAIGLALGDDIELTYPKGEVEVSTFVGALALPVPSSS